MTLPGGRVERLGEFVPGRRTLGFHLHVRVPVATHAGTATIKDDRSVPAIYQFTVGDRLMAPTWVGTRLVITKVAKLGRNGQPRWTTAPTTTPRAELEFYRSGRFAAFDGINSASGHWQQVTHETVSLHGRLVATGAGYPSPSYAPSATVIYNALRAMYRREPVTGELIGNHMVKPHVDNDYIILCSSHRR
jgi:hypothetical protein